MIIHILTKDIVRN